MPFVCMACLPCYAPATIHTARFPTVLLPPPLPAPALLAHLPCRPCVMYATLPDYSFCIASQHNACNLMHKYAPREAKFEQNTYLCKAHGSCRFTEHARQPVAPAPGMPCDAAQRAASGKQARGTGGTRLTGTGTPRRRQNTGPSAILPPVRRTAQGAGRRWCWSGRHSWRGPWRRCESWVDRRLSGTDGRALGAAVFGT